MLLVDAAALYARTCSPPPPPPPPPPMLECCWNFQCIGILTDPAIAARDCCGCSRWRPKWNSAVIQRCPSSPILSRHRGRRRAAAIATAPSAEIRNEDSSSRLTIANATACSPWALIARSPARPRPSASARSHSLAGALSPPLSLRARSLGRSPALPPKPHAQHLRPCPAASDLIPPLPTLHRSWPHRPRPPPKGKRGKESSLRARTD